MKTKQVVAIVAGTIVCVMCGFVLGYLSGSGILPGRQLSGTGFEGVSGSGGTFIVDGQQVDLSTLMMSLQMNHAGMLDGNIQDTMNELQARNESLMKANDMLALCRSNSNSGGAPTDELADFCSNNGIFMPSDSEYSSGDWDTLINAIKSYIDSLNSESQLDIIRLQALMEKRNQINQQASNTLSKDQKTRDSIVGNMR